VGVGYDESRLEAGWFTPTEGSWRGGDRRSLCVLDDPGGRMVDTMRNSRL
jgi:hypothetical protein